MNGHKIINQNELHFVTFTCVGWVDVFTRLQFKKILIDSLKHCIANKGLNLHAYVIMSNHIHLIISAKETYRLSDIIRDFKKYTTRTILCELIEGRFESRSEWMLRLFKYYAKFNTNNKRFQLWKRGNHPIELSSFKFINQKLNYIHNNPVKAQIVWRAEDYVYSSAGWYLRGEGILPVDVLDVNVGVGYVRM